MAKHQTPQSMRVRVAVGALIAGGMLFAGPAGIGFAAPGANGDNGNHGGGNGGQGSGNTGQGNGPGGGSTGSGSDNPGDPTDTGNPTDPAVGSLSGGTDWMLCTPGDVAAASCPEDPDAT